MEPAKKVMSQLLVPILSQSPTWSDTSNVSMVAA